MDDVTREKLVAARPTPTCPRCGCLAQETTTRYGIRSECCGLWSWNRQPLADARTHDARRRLAPFLSELSAAASHPGEITMELMKRMGINDIRVMIVSTMNEATATKTLAAAEDLLMDIMSGKVKL